MGWKTNSVPNINAKIENLAGKKRKIIVCVAEKTIRVIVLSIK